jgi:protein-arginine kinase activator protein McsA
MDPEHCEVCGKAAEVHTSEIRDGQKTEHHLCAEHANESGLPGHDAKVDIRSAISICSALLPEGRRSREAVAAEIRRLVERALTDFREGAEAFGFEA